MAKLHAEPLVQSFAFYRLGSFFVSFFLFVFFQSRKFLTFYSSLKSIKTSYTKLNHLKLFYRTLFFNLWDNLFKSFFSKNCRLTVRRALVLIQVFFWRTVRDIAVSRKRELSARMTLRLLRSPRGSTPYFKQKRPAHSCTSLFWRTNRCVKRTIFTLFFIIKLRAGHQAPPYKFCH